MLLQYCFDLLFSSGDTQAYSQRSIISKVGIHAWCIRTGVKGKVVSFKRKNGHWKRARMKLAVYVAGNIYNNGCTSLPAGLNVRYPSPTGYKNRKQLEVARLAALQPRKLRQVNLHLPLTRGVLLHAA